jgi:hypothetical protein
VAGHQWESITHPGRVKDAFFRPAKKDVEEDLHYVTMSDAQSLLRHAVATVAYRGGKALRHAPDGFADFAVAPGSRTPRQILAHINDLFDWALHLANGKQVWNMSTPGDWGAETARFFDILGRFDARLRAPEPLGNAAERLFQGPVADALTHIGQLAMLRRLVGAPLRGEDYFGAGIQAGRVGSDQPAPTFEFD